jgi:hypothetical protein
MDNIHCAILIGPDENGLALVLQNALPDLNVISLTTLPGGYHALEQDVLKRLCIKVIVICIKASDFSKGPINAESALRFGRYATETLANCLTVFCIDKRVATGSVMEHFGLVPEYRPDQHTHLVVRTNWNDQAEVAKTICLAYRLKKNTELVAKISSDR